jgi:MFS family permease
MTMVCGMARSYPQLLLARVGVGIGEAACSPPSHSLIADYFPPEKRATALAIYSMGVPIGVMIGFLCGGWIEYYFDWRTAFIVVGAPGILVAIIMRFTVAEPIRGRFEKVKHSGDRLGVMAVMKELAGMKSFVYLQVGNAFFAFAGYGLAFWLIPFFIRSHAMPLHEAASYLAIIGLLSGVVGAYCGGRLTDKLSRKNVNWYFWLPAGVLLVAMIGALFMLSSVTAMGALLWYFFHYFFNSAFSGPIYAAIQSMVKVEMRSQAVAIHLFVGNLIGLGLGPLVVGALSDYGLSDGGASGGSLQQALIVIVLFNVLAIVALLLGTRTLADDIKRVQRT